MPDKKYRIETQCIQAGYKAESGQPQVPPIVQNTTYRYYNAADVAKLFDLESADFMYTRLGSPTVNMLEEKMAALEGGTAAIAASSGQAANMITMLNICEAGDHIIAAANIYGGTYNLFGVTFKKMGIDVTFIDQNLSEDEIVRTVAMFRLIMPDAYLRFAGGRARLSEQALMTSFQAGINSAIIGDMLTTTGADVATDKARILAAGYML